MRVKWAIAAASALGLAFLTLNSSEVFDFAFLTSFRMWPAIWFLAASMSDFSNLSESLTTPCGKINS